MPSVTVGTTAASMTGGTPTPVNQGESVLVKYDGAGTSYVYVGFSNSVTAGTNAATDGMQLSPGQAELIPPNLHRGDLANVWLIAGAAGQKVFFQYPL